MIINNNEDVGNEWSIKQIKKKSNSDMKMVPPPFGRSQSIDSYRYQLEEKDKMIAVLRQATEVSE